VIREEKSCTEDAHEVGTPRLWQEIPNNADPRVTSIFLFLETKVDIQN
jgi:hypothetical protein